MRGGEGLFEHYSSLTDALRTVYPNHPWPDARHPGYPKLYGKQRELLDKIGKALGVNEVHYNVLSPPKPPTPSQHHIWAAIRLVHNTTKGCGGLEWRDSVLLLQFIIGCSDGDLSGVPLGRLTIRRGGTLPS